MYSRWSNAAVIILWLSAMGWLMVEKVLPPLLLGQPPSYRTILDAQRDEPPVGWNMSFDGRRLGWALSTTERLEDDLTEVRSWVHFDELPLDRLTPDWLRALVRLAERPVGNLEMDAKNTTLIDPLGRLSSFNSEVRVKPLDDLIRMQGTIEGTRLKIEIHTGGLVYETEKYFPTWCELPTTLVSLDVDSCDRFLERLRAHEPPVIARAQDDRVVFDVRTLADDEIPIVADAVAKTRETGSGKRET